MPDDTAAQEHPTEPFAATGVPAVRFSVVIPTRHRNDTLSECLDRLAPGVQLQPAATYEVIVTDDGSKSTAEAMLADRYPWTRWAAGPRKGPAANRNSGAARARAEWILFLDDDCLPEPGWIQSFAEAIQPDTRVYEGRTSCPDATGSVLEFAPVNETGGWLWSCNMMMHQDVFAAVGGFDENFPSAHMEDVDLRERLKAASISFQFVPTAQIFHPARRSHWRENLGKAHESEVMFWYKSGNRGPMWPTLTKNVVVGRTRWILRHRLDRDSLIFWTMSVREFFYVAAHVAGWERRYRRQFANAAGAPAAVTAAATLRSDDGEGAAA